MNNRQSHLEQLVQSYHIDRNASPSEFLAASKCYARAIVDDFDLDVVVSELDWDVSTRARRRAGATRYDASGPIGIRLTWRYFETFGWEAIAKTIRHELIHAHLLTTTGDGSHGPLFRQLALELDVDIHCERFSEPRWVIECQQCDARFHRYHRCPLVDETIRYKCGDCGGRLHITVEPSHD